jgi:hypothetical protein
LIKKPDYLGQSMWDFQYGGHTIQGKIQDVNWLIRFQNREINILPGDSIKAIVQIEVLFGDNSQIVAEHYTILNILEVLNRPQYKQERLNDTDKS